jgi:hypothetical protein
MNDLDRMAESINDRISLVAFLAELARDFRLNEDSWENNDIYAFLEAMSAWLSSADQLYKNLQRPIPVEPSWRFFAEMFLAARLYE